MLSWICYPVAILSSFLLSFYSGNVIFSLQFCSVTVTGFFYNHTFFLLISQQPSKIVIDKPVHWASCSYDALGPAHESHTHIPNPTIDNNDQGNGSLNHILFQHYFFSR